MDSQRVESLYAFETWRMLAPPHMIAVSESFSSQALSTTFTV
jgi:hypothetical protein